MFTVYRIYFNPYFFTVGLQYQATWRALCLGLRIRHVSRGEGESFVPHNPLNFRDRVSSFWGLLPPVLRPACLRFLRSAYLRFLWGPSCLLSKAHVPSVFEVLVPPLRVPTCNPRAYQLQLKYYIFSYITSHSSKTVEHCYSYSYSLLSNCCITITTTLHIVPYYSLHSCVYNNNSRSTYS